MAYAFKPITLDEHAAFGDWDTSSQSKKPWHWRDLLTLRTGLWVLEGIVVIGGVLCPGRVVRHSTARPHCSVRRVAGSYGFNILAHDLTCDAMFHCGCTARSAVLSVPDGVLFASRRCAVRRNRRGWMYCNVHNAHGPRCPFCDARKVRGPHKPL
jgi:hypothetical protein